MDVYLLRVEINNVDAAVTPYTRTDCDWLLDVHARQASGGLYMCSDTDQDF
jgi:hypothetical protein